MKAPIARSHCQSRPSHELYGCFSRGSLAEFLQRENRPDLARGETEFFPAREEAVFRRRRRRRVARKRRRAIADASLAGAPLTPSCRAPRRDVEMRETLKTRRPNTQGKGTRGARTRHAACPRLPAFPRALGCTRRISNRDLPIGEHSGNSQPSSIVPIAHIGPRPLAVKFFHRIRPSRNVHIFLCWVSQLAMWAIGTHPPWSRRPVAPSAGNRRRNQPIACPFSAFRLEPYSSLVNCRVFSSNCAMIHSPVDNEDLCASQFCLYLFTWRSLAPWKIIRSIRQNSRLVLAWMTTASYFSGKRFKRIE